MATLSELILTSPEATAAAALIEGGRWRRGWNRSRKTAQSLASEFPVILKPDVGQRGVGVKLIRSTDQAVTYLERTAAPLVLQRYAAGPLEAGLFYYRFPDEARGRIFAVTEKIFPTVTGDGKSTLAELIWSDGRARYVADKYLERFGGRRDEVLARGETLKLVEAGNHAQGCIFRDGARLRTPELEARLDEISQKVPGFFIGRYDVRFASEEDLKAGKGFQIIELNGAWPPRPRASMMRAIRSSTPTARCFGSGSLCSPSAAANRARGSEPTRLLLVWRKWREYARAWRRHIRVLID